MVLLQPKLNLRVTQKQILTPGLVQMVSVLALNKLELKDMINAEMIENPVLEELDPAVPLLDEVASREEERDRVAHEAETEPPFGRNEDPFEQIDFGSFFQDYLDPGYRTSAEIETVEKPSFENFLSKPSTLTDHLMWQLGASHATQAVRNAAELVIGNLNEDGYLIASQDELMAQAFSKSPAAAERDAKAAARDQAAASSSLPAAASPAGTGSSPVLPTGAEQLAAGLPEAPFSSVAVAEAEAEPDAADIAGPAQIQAETTTESNHAAADALFTRAELQQAIELVQQFDPIGVAAHDLRECLLAQLKYHQRVKAEHRLPENGTSQLLKDAIEIVSNHLRLVQNKQIKEIAKGMGRPLEAVEHAIDYIRTLDPKPGLRYNKVEPRLIEPDVAFVKQGDEYMVVMNDDDVPQLRLNTSYKRLLNRDAAEKDVRSYVKERYKSAIQLIKNIEQRKQTISKVCYTIVSRQSDFLDHGIDFLKPMMIKEVAEEIGVHPSTVSRAVANKYAHTPQGVFELRFFFSESVQGPEGGNTSLLILKRRVKKLIAEEDPTRPLTDEQITRILQSQGIQVTRRTVAKYREDMRIPSTHQRRVKK